MNTATIRPQYSNVEQAAWNVWEHTLEHGGGTFNPTTGQALTLDHGYMVATLADCVKIHESDTQAVDILAAFLQRQPVYGDGRKDLIGTWVHEGTVYVDTTELIEDRHEAITLGTLRKELAIWDNAAGDEIATS